MPYASAFIKYPLNADSLVERVRKRLPTGLGGKNEKMQAEHMKPRTKEDGIHLNYTVGMVTLSKQASNTAFRRFEYGVTDYMHLESGNKRRKVDSYKVYVWHQPHKNEDQPW